MHTISFSLFHAFRTNIGSHSQSQTCFFTRDHTSPRPLAWLYGLHVDPWARASRHYRSWEASRSQSSEFQRQPTLLMGQICSASRSTVANMVSSKSDTPTLSSNACAAKESRWHARPGPPSISTLTATPSRLTNCTNTKCTRTEQWETVQEGTELWCGMAANSSHSENEGVSACAD